LLYIIVLFIFKVVSFGNIIYSHDNNGILVQ